MSLFMFQKYFLKRCLLNVRDTESAGLRTRPYINNVVSISSINSEKDFSSVFMTVIG